MAKVLVLYYSSYGHIETMAYALAEGARGAGATVDVKRVPENVPEAVAKVAHFKLDQPAPIATPDELPNYDAIAVGAPTRFGRMPSAMGSFWERAGQLWMSGALHGKVGGAFTSSATQHGGNETTLFSIIANLMHFGMVIVGLPYSHVGQMTLDEIVGGAPYGATTIAGGQGQRLPTKLELDGARHQGELIAKAADRQNVGLGFSEAAMADTSLKGKSQGEFRLFSPPPPPPFLLPAARMLGYPFSSRLLYQAGGQQVPRGKPPIAKRRHPQHGANLPLAWG
jgi:NAD(P)H dehydrogenase (quinone)